MARRELGEINAGSMADIAFLLLIFFLVTTTMDVDSGLMRKLPPPIEKPDEKPPVIKERNVFIVLINSNNQLQVEGELTAIEELKEKTKEFILNPLDKENLPEKEEHDVPFFGKVRISKGVISLQNDRGTSYETYIAVQNKLISAYDEIRDDIANRRFGKKFDDCNEDQQKSIKTIYPASISEAEPKNVGGN